EIRAGDKYRIAPLPGGGFGPDGIMRAAPSSRLTRGPVATSTSFGPEAERPSEQVRGAERWDDGFRNTRPPGLPLKQREGPIQCVAGAGTGARLADGVALGVEDMGLLRIDIGRDRGADFHIALAFEHHGQGLTVLGRGINHGLA